MVDERSNRKTLVHQVQRLEGVVKEKEAIISKQAETIADLNEKLKEAVKAQKKAGLKPA